MSRNRVFYKVKDLFLLGDADLTEHGAGGKKTTKGTG